MFNLHDFHLASHERVIDIDAIDSRVYSTHSQTLRIVYS